MSAVFALAISAVRAASSACVAAPAASAPAACAAAAIIAAWSMASTAIAAKRARAMARAAPSVGFFEARSPDSIASATAVATDRKRSASTLRNSLVISALSAASRPRRSRAAAARAAAPSAACEASSIRCVRKRSVSSFPVAARSVIRTALRMGSASRSACDASTRRSCASSSFWRASSILGSASAADDVIASARRLPISASIWSARRVRSAMAASTGCSAAPAWSRIARSAAIAASKASLARSMPAMRALATSGPVRSPDASIDVMAAMRRSISRASAPFSCASRSSSIRSSISASRRIRVARSRASRRCASPAPAEDTSDARLRNCSAASAGDSMVCVSSRLPPSSSTVLPTASGDGAMRAESAAALAATCAILRAPASSGLGACRPSQAARTERASEAPAMVRTWCMAVGVGRGAGGAG